MKRMLTMTVTMEVEVGRDGTVDMQDVPVSIAIELEGHGSPAEELEDRIVREIVKGLHQTFVEEAKPPRARA